MSTSGCTRLRPWALPKTWRSSSYSSWRTRWRPKTSSGSATSASSARRRRPWASCSTTLTSGRPLIEGTAHRFHAHARQPDGRDHAGAQCRGLWPDVRGAHGLARPGRHLASGTRGQPAPRSCGHPTSGSKSGAGSRSTCTRCFRGCPRCATGTCIRATVRGWGSISTRTWRLSILVPNEVIGWTQTRLPDGSPARP